MLETFASVVRYETVRLIFALKVIKQYEMIQFDVTTAFLNGLLDEDVYMIPPDGIACPKGKVLKLNKSLYGLKQSPRCWQMRFDNILVSLGLKATQADPCLYTGEYRGQEVHLIIYVDDGLAIARDKHTLSLLIGDIAKEIRIKVIETKVFVGFEIETTKHEIRLHQKKYIDSMLEKYNMSTCTSAPTPMNNPQDLNESKDDEPITSAPYRELVGSLNYSACVCRPDITYAVSVLSRYLHKPLDKHWTAAKRVLRYLKGSATLGISFQHTPKVNIECYSDADWAGDTAKRRSTSGMLITIAGGGIIFKSKLQKLVAMSTAEAEYTACSLATREIIWVKTLLNELNVPIASTTLLVDNQAALKLVHNPEFHSRTKHFDIRMHSIREHHKMGLFQLNYVPTKNQQADVLTKSLAPCKHKEMVTKIGMHNKLNAAAFLALIAMITVVGCNNLQIEDPVIWRTTTTGHVQGSIDLDLELTFFNPCAMMFSNLTGIPMTDDDLVYTCNKRYNQDIIKILMDMNLGQRRTKRDGGVTALTIAAFSALYVSAYSHQAARTRTFNEEAKEKYEMLKLLGEQVALLQEKVIISNEKMSSKIEQLGTDIGVLSTVVETQAQTTSALLQALIEINKEKAFLQKLKEDLKLGGPVPEALLKRVNISSIQTRVSLYQSTVHYVRFINETLYVKTTLLKLSDDTSILRADPFSYTGIENNMLCQFVYTGPEFVLYNLTSNCVRPVEKTEIIEDVIITEGCTHKSVEDKKRYKPTNCHQQDENNLVKPKAQYKHHGRKLLVNCQMHTMISGGVKRACPNYVFSAERDATFLVDDFEFTFFRHSLASSGVSYMIPERINLHLGTAKTEFKSLSANEVEKLENASRAFKDKQATMELTANKGPSQLDLIQDGTHLLIKSIGPYLSILLTMFILFLVLRSLCRRPAALVAMVMFAMGPNMIICTDPRIVIKLNAADATMEINALQKTMQLQKCNGWSINEDYEMWEKGVGQYAVSVACGLSKMSITCPCDSSVEFVPIVNRNELNAIRDYKNPECHNTTNSELYKDQADLFDIASEYLCNYTRTEDFPKKQFGQLIASGCTLAKLAFNCFCHGNRPHKRIYTDILSSTISNVDPTRNAECVDNELKLKERQKLYETSIHARFYKNNRTSTI